MTTETEYGDTRLAPTAPRPPHARPERGKEREMSREALKAWRAKWGIGMSRRESQPYRRLLAALCTLADFEPLFTGNDHSSHGDVCNILRECVDEYEEARDA
jgi:hypothetical protein